MEKQKFNKFGLYQQGYQQRNEDHRNRFFMGLKLGIIFGVPVLAILLTLFIFRFYHIEGPSMAPTLHNDERVIIEKFAKTWASLRREAYVPERYDIVVLREPNDGTHVIKRVIGLPGDRVVIKDDVVTVINKQHPKGYQVDKRIPVDFNLDDRTPGKLNTTVRKGHVFVLGDNRNQSRDSRIFGPVKTSDIVGQLWIKLNIF